MRNNGHLTICLADIIQNVPRLPDQLVRAGGLQLVRAAEAPHRAQGRQAGVVAGGDVHVAVAHKQGGGGVRAQGGHQAVDAGGVGLDRHAGAAAPHQREGPGGEVMVDDATAQGVRLVGKDRRLDALGFEGGQQFPDAGIGGGLVLLDRKSVV